MSKEYSQVGRSEKAVALVLAGIVVIAFAILALGGCDNANASPLALTPTPAADAYCWPPPCNRILNYSSALDPTADRHGRIWVNKGEPYALCEETIPEGWCLIVTRFVTRQDGNPPHLVAIGPGGSTMKLASPFSSQYNGAGIGKKFPAGTTVGILSSDNGPVTYDLDGYLWPEQ